MHACASQCFSICASNGTNRSKSEHEEASRHVMLTLLVPSMVIDMLSHASAFSQCSVRFVLDACDISVALKHDDVPAHVIKRSASAASVIIHS